MVATVEPPSTSSTNVDLTSVTKDIYYKGTVSYLSDTMGMDILAFQNNTLCQQFYIDTSHCVTKHKTYNVKCLYETFAEYCDMIASEVKDRLIKEIKIHIRWFMKASTASLGMRGISFDAWFKKHKKPRTWPNEYALYALCIVFRRNAIVKNAGHTWTTMKLQEGMPFDSVLEMCETRLLYLGNNLYVVLRRHPFTLIRPIEFKLDDMQKMRPLHEDLVEG